MGLGAWTGARPCTVGHGHDWCARPALRSATALASWDGRAVAVIGVGYGSVVAGIEDSGDQVAVHALELAASRAFQRLGGNAVDVAKAPARGFV